MQPNTIVFVGAYLLLMVPTYVLPYFGSNSSIVNALSAVAGFGMTPQWWAHAWSLTMLCLLTWTRGGVMGRMWMPVLPILASVFDLVPVLSSIPFVPTLLHIGGIIAGIIGTPNAQDTETTTQQATLRRKASWSAAIATLCAIGGTALFLTTTKSAIQRAGAANRIPTPAAPVHASPPAPAPATPAPASAPITKQAAPLEPPAKHKPLVKHQPPAGKDKIAKPPSSGTSTRYINLND